MVVGDTNAQASAQTWGDHQCDDVAAAAGADHATVHDAGASAVALVPGDKKHAVIAPRRTRGHRSDERREPRGGGSRRAVMSVVTEVGCHPDEVRDRGRGTAEQRLELGEWTQVRAERC